jgi:hypothetical protein
MSGGRASLSFIEGIDQDIAAEVIRYSKAAAHPASSCETSRAEREARPVRMQSLYWRVGILDREEDRGK